VVWLIVHLRLSLLLRKLLVDIRFRDTDRQGPDSRDDTNAFGDADRSASVEDVEEVRTLHTKIEGSKDREALQF
jgi:hypothetical protein